MSKIDTRYKQIGHRKRASSRYAMIANRVKNSHLPKNKAYRGVELRVSREDFIQWFMENDFAGCSVDRIDPKGHYELSNMQLIPTGLNAGKDKLRLNLDGTRTCSSCKIDKPLVDFVKDRRRLIIGVTSVCKPCESKRGSERYKKRKWTSTL